MSKRTPEGKVKEMIKARLESVGCLSSGQAVKVTHEHSGWFYMPVSNGMGVHGIPDFIGHYRGQFFAVEAKAPGGKPTPLQVIQLHAIDRTGGIWGVVDGEISLDDFMEEFE
jgi:hypothetical protein